VLKENPTSFPAELDGERRLERRRFLCVSGAVAVVVAAGHALGRRLEADRPRPPALARAEVADLAPGVARPFARAGGTTLAVRLPEGDVVAFDRRCPHLGCPVVWAAARGRFECPCHHAAFDARTGEVLFGPPTRGLTPVEVRS
jgi:cytochrome b6-f complex iron-sulfur subunit